MGRPLALELNRSIGWNNAGLLFQQGRSLSLTEDVLDLQQEENAQTMGFLQGARVHLPIITEDNQAQEATGPETGTTQYLAQERKVWNRAIDRPVGKKQPFLAFSNHIV